MAVLQRRWIVSLQFDPQIGAVVSPLLAAAAERGATPAGDVATRRRDTRLLLEEVLATRVPASGADVTRYTLTTDSGATLEGSWYRRAGLPPSGSAVLYLHGGGMILGLADMSGLYDWLLRGYVAASGVPMLLVDYRVAPEFAYPVPVEDCYAALVWLVAHADELGADPTRLAVMGDSAGGGLAAGVCLLARDRGGPAIAQQLLIYPMLDDRTSVPDPRLLPFLTWTYDDNVTGWRALLGDRAGTDEVSTYAAPSRASELASLPSAYVDVGELDIFRDEDIDYARRLADAGVATELHVHPGCPHGFEALAPDADVSGRAIADRLRRLSSF